MSVKVSSTGLDVIAAGTKRENVRVVWDETTSVQLTSGEVRISLVGVEIASENLNGVTVGMADLFLPMHRVCRVEIGPEKKWRDATGPAR